MCPHVCVEVSVYALCPAPSGLSNGKISRHVPAQPTQAYLCGFISELTGPLGGVLSLPSCEHRMEGNGYIGYILIPVMS